MKRLINNIIGAALLITAPIIGFACTEDTTEPDVMVTITSDSEGVTIDGTGTSAEVVLVPTGSDATLNITSTGDWQIVGEEEDTWCEITETAEGVTVSAREFVSDYTHSTMLRVVSGGKSMGFIKVSQQGTEVVALGLSMKEVVFDERGGDIIVDVTTNKDVWNVAFDDPNANGWLSVTEGEGSFTLTAIANIMPAEFETTLTVWTGTEDNNTTVTLPVKLLPWTEGYISFHENLLELKTKKIVITEEGGDLRIPVYSNREWEATSDDDWMSLTVERDTLVITTEPSTEQREAMITITTISGKDAGLTTEALTRQLTNPYTLEITIPEGGATLGAPIYDQVNVCIDWGDGSNPDFVDKKLINYQQPKHDYLKGGVYELKIYGESESLYCDYGNHLITKILKWGNLGATRLDYAFAGTSIKEIPEGYKEIFLKATTLSFAFAGSTLEKIPDDMFEGMSIGGGCTFWGCNSLTEIPVTMFEGSYLNSVGNMFLQCTGITEIPENLFDPLPNLNNASACFSGCTGLKSVPAGLFKKCPELSSIGFLFRDCFSLETVEPGFLGEHTKIEQARGVFEMCGNLKSIGTDFLSKSIYVRTVETMFEGCVSLTGESPFCYIDNEKVHLYERPNYPEIFVDSWVAMVFDPVTGWVIRDKDGNIVEEMQTFILPHIYAGSFLGCTGLSDYDAIPDSWK